MEWQEWDPNEANKRHHRVSFSLSNTGTPVLPSSQWSFTPVSTAPTWPQTCNQTPFPASSNTIQSPTIGNPWDTFNASFGDSTLWGQWDESGGFGNDQTAVLGAHYPSYAPVANVSQQAIFRPLSSPLNQAVDSDGFDAGFVGQVQQTTHSSGGKRDISNMLNEEAHSSDSGLPPQKQSHKGTEKKYRSKLNDEFTTLFQALPQKHLGAGVGGEFSSGMSKAETLQLAISHIEMLEKQQKELKQESLVLKGQVGLFESLYKGPGR